MENKYCKAKAELDGRAGRKRGCRMEGVSGLPCFSLSPPFPYPLHCGAAVLTPRLHVLAQDARPVPRVDALSAQVDVRHARATNRACAYRIRMCAH
jgi:hypothetical protein